MNKHIYYLFLFLINLISVQRIQALEKGYDFGFGIESYADKPEFYNKVFSYNYLSKKQLNYKEIDFSSFLRDTIFFYNKKQIYCGQNESLRAYYISDCIQTLQEGRIILKEKSYSIDSLYSKEEAFNPIILSSVYYLNFNSFDYILLFLSPIVSNSNTIPYKGILFRMNSQGNEIIVFPQYQYSNSFYCINDFNNDGNLEYLYLNDFNASIYTIRDDMLIKSNKYLIKLDNMPPGYGFLKSIDKKNSKWFYPLK